MDEDFKATSEFVESESSSFWFQLNGRGFPA